MKETIIVAVPGHVSSRHASVLRDIHDPEVNIAVWERTPAIPSSELDGVLDLLHEEVRVHGCTTAIMRHLRSAFMTLGLEAPVLLDDVAWLLEEFARTARATDLRFLLSAVTTNMCRRFHTDMNEMRLLCTYRGPGTLWLPNDAVNEHAIRSQNPELPIERSPADILQVATGHVAIIKGALYPGTHMGACVHRSPTIEEAGERRLLLRVDPNVPLFGS
ncbi:MAG: DUF1826 domain-containing protein [Flavobacteriales bacterium]